MTNSISFILQTAITSEFIFQPQTPFYHFQSYREEFRWLGHYFVGNVLSLFCSSYDLFIDSKEAVVINKLKYLDCETGLF